MSRKYRSKDLWQDAQCLKNQSCDLHINIIRQISRIIPLISKKEILHFRLFTNSYFLKVTYHENAI